MKGKKRTTHHPKRQSIKTSHIMAVILAASFATMALHMTDAFGGYHGATNEAFYTQLGISIAKKPLSYPHMADGRIDYNIPPLLPYLLGTSFTLFGVSEASARLVPIAFSTCSVLLVYLLGRRIYDERTALAASAIFAFTPMELMVGRNVQTDPIFLALGLLGVYLYLEDRMIMSGIALGLAFTAKQPAALFLAGIVLLQLLKKKPLRSVLTLTLAFALATLPYLSYNLLENGGKYLNSQSSNLLLPISKRGQTNDIGFLASETFWGLSPMVALTFAVGLIHTANKRRQEDLPPLLFCLISIAFFLLYNYHSYYILPLAPFAALISARLLSRIKTTKIFAAATIIIVASGLFYGLLMLCGNKYGHEELKRLPQLYGQGTKPELMITELIAGSYIDGLRYYNPDAEIVDLKRGDLKAGEMIPLDYTRPIYSLIHRTEIQADKLPKEAQEMLFSNSAKSDRYALVIFGFVFNKNPINPHFFTNGPLQINRNMPITSFGVYKVMQVPELYLMRMDPNERLYKDKDGSLKVMKPD
jgi:Gpi18-like mannosyltransferase